MSDCIIMFVVIDPLAAKEFGEVNEDLMKNQDLINAVMEDIQSLAKANKFNSLEKPKSIKLLKDAWTDGDLLTPTMKMKRNLAKLKYQEDIVMMYESIKK